MRLRIAVPSHMIVDEEVRSVRAIDGSGEFGIRPGHEPFHAALTVGILSYVSAAGQETFVALRRGVLWVRDDVVDVATRDAVVNDSLDALEERVLEDFLQRDAAEYESDTSLRKMQFAALRELMGYEHVQVAG